MFDPNKVLLQYARFVESAKSSLETSDGVEVGLSNTLKQMYGQSGQHGKAVVKIDGKEINVHLNNWTPARKKLGYGGELVQPNAGGGSEIQKAYFSGFNDKIKLNESAYLVAWLAISVLNGRFPTSGAANVETSHKSHAILKLHEIEQVEFVSATIPGASVKKNGTVVYTMPEMTCDGATLITMCKYFANVSKHMIANLDKRAHVVKGLDESTPDWLKL